jgi:hypothetical protein
MKALELRGRLSRKHEVHGRCYTVLTKLLLVGLVGAGCAGPQGPAVGEIARSGLCIQEVGGQYSQPQSTAGYATTGPLTLTDRTTEVPLRQGVAFGYAWKASNLPNPVVITYRVEHPAITRPDGVTMSRFEEELEVETVGGKFQSTDCYALSEKFELVPGTWTLSVLFRGSLLAKQSFHVHASE